MQLTSYTSSLLTEPLLDQQNKKLDQQNKNELNPASEKATNLQNSKQQETDVDSDPEVEAKSKTSQTQQELVAKIKELQNKINSLKSNEELAPEQRENDLFELNKQLDEEINAVQLTVKRNVSTMINSLFAPTSSTHSGMLFNNKA
ncbi:hypothetical protein [Pseudoalteromonas sp. L21]|uniref:hypothetical protein n=1 Tax=Pseudoalteromonas sp. L21 TaxID=1539746 RepID=UPI001F20389D|nr:hypothetical protein [Pseudoalteromonas sp. L21]MCF7517750.1 hypothetical protein [Pseudoalteromonas sp. L21]